MTRTGTSTRSRSGRTRSATWACRSSSRPRSAEPLPTTLHPTAGFIADLAGGAPPGPLSRAGRTALRRLAQGVREAAADPRYAERRERWYRHNDLEPAPPMLLVFPEDSWIEVLPAEELALDDPFWRQWEWYLRHLLWRHEQLDDDFVIEPELAVPLAIRRSGWGLEARYIRAGPKGSYVWEGPVAGPADLDRLRQPEITVDAASTSAAVQALGEALGDLLPVRTCCPVPAANLIGEVTTLRGLERTLLDFHDEPDLVHWLMAFVASGVQAELDLLEADRHLTLNNRGHYTDSGGVGWTRRLPDPSGPAAAGGPVRSADLWGFGVAQELSGVSPAQHEEFVLSNQLPILERFGLVAYGCCEPYTRKFAMLKRAIPRLRRVSVSPWCDVGEAAEELGDRYLFSWKPNPAMIAAGFEPEAIRTHLRSTLERARGCRVEIVLKDTFTVQGDARRFVQWARIARGEIERAAGR